VVFLGAWIPGAIRGRQVNRIEGREARQALKTED